MHIITIEDQDFPELLELFQNSTHIGQFTEKGHVKLVRANKRLVMISGGVTAEKIAIKPVRTQNEARRVAYEFLHNKAMTGNSVNLD